MCAGSCRRKTGDGCVGGWKASAAEGRTGGNDSWLGAGVVGEVRVGVLAVGGPLLRPRSMTLP